MMHALLLIWQGLVNAWHHAVNTSAAKRPRYTLRCATLDVRDQVYSSAGKTILESSDLRAKLPPCWDQGQLGSCTAHGWAAMMVFLFGINHMFSRLFIYFIERMQEGTISQDNGAEIRTGGKVLAKYGAPPETLWVYVVRKFKTRPTAAVFAAALGFKLPKYMQVTTLNDMLACLSEGFPVVIGVTLFKSFESDEVARTGMVPMPTKGEEQVGGHCMAAVGHDMKRQLVLIRNSWSTKWGVFQGHCWMPMAYFTTPGLADPSWTARR